MNQNRTPRLHPLSTSQQRSARVAEVRRSVRVGSYRVPSEEVAEALLAWFWREPEPDEGTGKGV
jgi:anti-sigma28 factor (negative regulator of flagellin synthesis)